MQSHLADIDELVVMCRDDEARQYIAEAVASYKVGAFRACIVMTWIAVVYDFLYKLRELEIGGDGQARDILGNFEKARKDSDYTKSQKLENNVLKYAYENFEFINEIEFKELERLKDDRNRCAHPSMTSEDEIYSPSSELARYHLRNAVNYMLQYPPIQGKTLRDRLLKRIESPLFATNLQEAVASFKSDRLDRARKSVIRNLAITLIKGLLTNNQPDGQFERTSRALCALRLVRREIVEEAMVTHVSNAITQLEDEHLSRVFRFLNAVDDTYEYLREDVRIRLSNYLKPVEQFEQFLEEDDFLYTYGKTQNYIKERIFAWNVALEMPLFAEMVWEVLDSPKYGEEILAKLIEYKVRPEFVTYGLKYYRSASTLLDANSAAERIVIPLIEHQFIGRDDVVTIFSICEKNEQVYNSPRFKEVLKAIHATRILSDDELASVLSGFEAVASKYYSTIFSDSDDMKIDDDDIPF